MCVHLYHKTEVLPPFPENDPVVLISKPCSLKDVWNSSRCARDEGRHRQGTCRTVLSPKRWAAQKHNQLSTTWDISFLLRFLLKKDGGGSVFSSRGNPHLTFPNPDTTATRGKELKSDILRQKIHRFRLVTFFSQEMP